MARRLSSSAALVVSTVFIASVACRTAAPETNTKSSPELSAENPFVTRDGVSVPLPSLKPGISRVTRCDGSEPKLNAECASVAEEALFRETAAVSFKFHQAQNPTPGTLSRRDFHPKQHACVAARFEVLDQIPASLRQGVFKNKGTFAAVMRFSNGSPQVPAPGKGIVMKPDITPDSRGLAIKLVGVPGEPILDEPAPIAGQASQDFLMINFPAFFLRKADNYANVLRGLAKGEVLQQLDELERKNLIGGQKVIENALAERYWSETPYRLGANAAIKYSVAPCTSADAWPLTDTDRANENYLRQRAAEKLAANDQCMVLSVQVQKDPKAMPVEDAAIDWPESLSPFVPVARIIAPRGQNINDSERDAFCQNLSFNPWNSIVDHAPMGGINRARLLVYAGIARKRRMENAKPIGEPTPAHAFFDVLSLNKK